MSCSDSIIDLPCLTPNTDLQVSTAVRVRARFNILLGGSRYVVISGWGGGKGFVFKSVTTAAWKSACLILWMAGL